MTSHSLHDQLFTDVMCSNHHNLYRSIGNSSRAYGVMADIFLNNSVSLAASAVMTSCTIVYDHLFRDSQGQQETIHIDLMVTVSSRAWGW